MTPPWTILLFEDQPGPGQRLVETVREELSEDCTVVWFKNFTLEDTDRKPSLHARGFGNHERTDWLGRQWSWPLRPLRREDLEVHPAPQAGSEYHEKERWWPEDFHGAILDEYSDEGGTAVGHHLLEWLNGVGFEGPVFFASQFRVPHTTYPYLPRLRVTIKTVSGWYEEAAEHIHNGVVSLGPNLPAVGLAGRDPDRPGLVGRFRAAVRTHDPKAKFDDLEARWLDLRRTPAVDGDRCRAKNLLNLDVRESVSGEEETGWVDSLMRGMGLTRGDDNPPLAFHKGPPLIVLDCGEECTAEDVRDVQAFFTELDRIADLASDKVAAKIAQYPPLTLLLANRNQSVGPGDFTLLRNGVVCVMRAEFLGGPMVWIASQVERFLQTVRMLEEHGKVLGSARKWKQKRDKEIEDNPHLFLKGREEREWHLAEELAEAREKEENLLLYSFFESLLIVDYLAGGARERVAPSTRAWAVPTALDWFAFKAGDTRTLRLNTGFTRRIKDAVDELESRELVSKRTLRRVKRKSSRMNST